MKKVRVREFLSTGEFRPPSDWLAKALTLLSILLLAFGVWANLFGKLDPYVMSAVFLCAMLPVALLLYTPTKNSKAMQPGRVDYFLALLSLATGLYIYLQSSRLLVRWATVDPLTKLDWFFGIAIIILAIEVTRRALGPGLTAVVILFVLYSLFGHYLPGQFYHRPVSLRYYVDSIAFTGNGVMGSTTYVAATYVFMFVGFGVFLDRANGGNLFSKVANALAGHRVGGQAKVAVISSGLYGSISGSPTADVMTTGSFTIPLMKKMGYDSEVAGAIEAVASTGGAMLPPVMGSAAFLMVQLTGTPYRTLAVAAFVPALLYYLGVFQQVHFHSSRLGFSGLPKDQLPRLVDAFKESGEFILPFIILIYFLLSGYAPAFTAIAATFAVVAVSWLRKPNRLTLAKSVDTVNILIRRLAPITGACAAAGLVIGGITITGFGGRMITLINTLAGNSSFITLVIAALVSIILGMGMPTPAVYILVAVLIGPALTERGIPLLAAHLFLIWFSAISAITPPVAVAAYSAASIAEANPMQIGWKAVRLGIAAFLVPFVFVYNPGVLLQGSLPLILWSIFAAAVGVIAVAAGLEGYLMRPLTSVERFILGAGGLAAMTPWVIVAASGITVVAVISILQLARKKEGIGKGIERNTDRLDGMEKERVVN